MRRSDRSSVSVLGTGELSTVRAYAFLAIASR
jgi:hypothetical protein